MNKTSRRKFSAEFKSKVCIETLKEQQTIEALAKKYEVHLTQINSWKKEFLQHSSLVFEKEGNGSSGADDKDQLIQALYAQIGEQKVAIDFLKKNCCKAVGERRLMTEKNHNKVSVVRQCGLLSNSRSGLYYEPVGESEENLAVMRFLDEQYLKTPFYGVERLLVLLVLAGYRINRKRLRRLMQLQGWQTLYPAVRTTRTDEAAYKYPYLLKGLRVERKNQVWAIDITYIPMKSGFMYLCAIIDVRTRSVVGWAASATL